MNKVKFFSKFISIIIIVIVVLVLLNSWYVKSFYYLDVYGEVKKFEDGVPNNIDYANFGSSHGLACFKDYSNEDGCFNFALSGEDVYHDFNILKQYTDNLNEGCVIAIPISYFSFCTTLDEPSQKRYYLFLDKKYISKFSYETYINTKLLPVMRSGEYVFKELFINEDAMGDIFAEDNKENELAIDNSKINMINLSTSSGGMSADISDTYDNGVPRSVVLTDEYAKGIRVDLPEVKIGSFQTDDQLAINSGIRAKSWQSDFKTKGKFADENKQLWIDMINYCYEHNFRPIVVSAPIHSSLNEKFSSEELNEYYFDYLYEVVEETGAPLLDLSHDSDYADSNYLFGNCDHLNIAGSTVFMVKYNAFLKNLGYIE